MEKWIIKQKMSVNDKLSTALEDLEQENGGDCVGSSFKIFQKLSKVGGKRVRGLVNNKDAMVDFVGNGKYFHYWVESKGMVFDDNKYQMVIAPIDEYYKYFQITDVEYADDGFFYKYNKKLEAGIDNYKYLKYFLLPNKGLALV